MSRRAVESLGDTVASLAAAGGDAREDAGSGARTCRSATQDGCFEVVFASAGGLRAGAGSGRTWWWLRRRPVGSRSVTRSRLSRTLWPGPAGGRFSCIRRRRWRRISSARSKRSGCAACILRPTTGIRRTRSAPTSGVRANILLTNPDMLNIGILPNHEAWADFLRNLEIVAVDEAHVLRGVFGSHVAAVLRRLRRVAMLHGGDPKFVLDERHDSQPSGARGEPHGRAFQPSWTTTALRRASGASCSATLRLLDKEKGERRSLLTEGALVFANLVSQGVRTIAFARTRKVCRAHLPLRRRQAWCRWGAQDLPLPRGLYAP